MFLVLASFHYYKMNGLTSIALEKSDQVCFMGVQLVVRSILKFYLNSSRKIGSSLFRGSTVSNKEYFKMFPY